ncbi:MAG: hypothetical protein JWR26_3790 [Pedosphaera sp.]|nr:hypothetical protein [Pedosphaera sp.]
MECFSGGWGIGWIGRIGPMGGMGFGFVAGCREVWNCVGWVFADLREAEFLALSRVGLPHERDGKPGRKKRPWTVYVHGGVACSGDMNIKNGSWSGGWTGLEPRASKAKCHLSPALRQPTRDWQVLAHGHYWGSVQPRMGNDARGPACGTRCARVWARRTGFPSLATQVGGLAALQYGLDGLASQALQVSCPQESFASRKAISPYPMLDCWRGGLGHGHLTSVARGGTWAAFGRPLGGHATDFGRVGSPKCLLMLPCTCSYRPFFESFIGVLGVCTRPPWEPRMGRQLATSRILSRPLGVILFFLCLHRGPAARDTANMGNQTDRSDRTDQVTVRAEGGWGG